MPAATLAATSSSLASLIPAAELAAAVRLAFQTLTRLLTDEKSPPRDRRMAAMAILRLTSPGREPRGNPPPSQPSPPPATSPDRQGAPASSTAPSPEIATPSTRSRSRLLTERAGGTGLVPRLPLDVAPEARDLPAHGPAPGQGRLDRSAQVRPRDG